MSLRRKSLRMVLRSALLSLSLVTLSGCATLSYYGQSVTGHLGIMAKAEPISDFIEKDGVPEDLKAKLEKVQGIREYASSQLGLPDNGSYRTYADIERPYVVWNVFATPELSLQPKKWCFLVVGCVSYRGYYDQKEAEAFAERLREQGHDVHIGEVPAYSTLGWFDDPVLNTMLHWNDTRLAGLIFHELSHQEVFVKGDTTFNEGFATAVSQVGVLRWLKDRGGQPAVDRYLEQLSRDEDFAQLLERTRARLEKLYASNRSEQEKRAGKEQVFATMREEYAALKASWNGYAGYDRWFAKPINNARLSAISAYRKYVPGFLALLDEVDGDLEAFYEAVREIGSLDKPARRERLEKLAGDEEVLTLLLNAAFQSGRSALEAPSRST